MAAYRLMPGEVASLFGAGLTLASGLASFSSVIQAGDCSRFSVDWTVTAGTLASLTPYYSNDGENWLPWFLSPASVTILRLATNQLVTSGPGGDGHNMDVLETMPCLYYKFRASAQTAAGGVTIKANIFGN